MNIIKSTQSILKKIPPFRRVVIGVSGGADSTVLAHMLKDLGYDITIAHLNHQLRGKESDKDEVFVNELAKKWGVGYICERVKIPTTGNLENNARKIRYEFFEKVRQEYEADFIAVAHHFDDQIETILMHIARGAGLRGQIGMGFRSDSLIRPLLDVRRKDIEKYAKDNSLDFRTDETNFDLDYERNYWRHKLIPSMNSKDLEAEIRSISANAKKKLDVVSKKAEKWLNINLIDEKFDKDQFNKLSDDIKSEVLIQILGADDLYEKSISRLIEFISDGHSGRGVKVKNMTFSIEHSHVLVHQYDNADIDLPKAKITIDGIKWGKWIIKSKANDLYVRQWQKGDRFRPSGMKGSKKLQDFFVDKKIPLHQRKQIPIIVDKKDDIIAIGDLRIAEGAEYIKNDLIISKK